MPRPQPFHIPPDRHDDKMLRRLGAAYVAQYHNLPKDVRDLIEDQAGAVVDNSLMAKPRKEIAELIRKYAPEKPNLPAKGTKKAPAAGKRTGAADAAIPVPLLLGVYPA